MFEERANRKEVRKLCVGGSFITQHCSQSIHFLFIMEKHSSCSCSVSLSIDQTLRVMTQNWTFCGRAQTIGCLAQ